MVESTAIALISPGGHTGKPPHLNNDGVRQAFEAGDKLLEGDRFLGAIVLSSTVPAAAETADRIAMKIDDGKSTYVIGHVALEEGGRYPQFVDNLRSLAHGVITFGMSEQEVAYAGPLVIVTHPPLIAAMMGIERAEGGTVYLYNTGDGRNPKYSTRIPEADRLRFLGLSPAA